MRHLRSYAVLRFRRCLTIEITILASQPYVQDAALVRFLALVEQRHAVTDSIEQRSQRAADTRLPPARRSFPPVPYRG
jgi:hypothetical protein